MCVTKVVYMHTPKLVYACVQVLVCDTVVLVFLKLLVKSMMEICGSHEERWSVWINIMICINVLSVK